MQGETIIYFPHPCVKFEQIVHREHIPQWWAGGYTQMLTYTHIQMYTLNVLVDITIIL